MEKRYLTESELMINNDGSIFHLHLKPEQLAGKVILVGDPSRVNLVATHFKSKECEVESREFHSITGLFHDKRITVISTGIGCDNIDIVLNEIDALSNIDFNTRAEHSQIRSLEIVRIGTCGGLQLNVPTGTFICSETSIGFDGLLNFYAGRDSICDLSLEQALTDHLGWSGKMCCPAPYAVNADAELTSRISGEDMVRGITVSCGGFFGPQGRQLRIALADPCQNDKVESFSYNGRRITNYEMESSAIAGLSKLLGHRATTTCMVIANRVTQKADTGYKSHIDDLIRLVLERI